MLSSILCTCILVFTYTVYHKSCRLSRDYCSNSQYGDRVVYCWWRNRERKWIETEEESQIGKQLKFQEMLEGLRQDLGRVPEHRTGSNTRYEIADAGLSGSFAKSLKWQCYGRH